MKKLLTTFLLIIIFASIAFPQTTFIKSYVFSGNPSKVIPTSDGGYLLSGSTYFTDSAQNTTNAMSVIKTDSLGDTLWVKAFLSNGLLSNAFETFDHGFILMGWQQDSLHQYTDYQLFIKLDSIGNLVWKRHLPGGTPDYGITPHDFIQISDSGFILLEQTWDMNYQRGVEILKFDKDGFFQWYKRIVPNNLWEEMTGMSLLENSSGNLFIAGFNHIGSNPLFSWLLETDNNGVILKCNRFNSAYALYLNHIKCAVDGSMYLSGTYFDSVFSYYKDPLVIKCDPAGNIIWAKAYPLSMQPSLVFDFISNPDLTSTFTYEYTDGNSNYYNNVVHIDSSGHVLWTNYFTDPPYWAIQSLCFTPDSGYVLFFQDHDLIKTNSFGNTGCNDSAISTIDSAFNMTLTDVTNDIHDSVSTLNHLNIGLRDTTFSFTITTNCFYSVGVGEIKLATNYHAFPNPFIDHSVIDVSDQTSNIRCLVYDISGKLIKIIPSANGKITISGNELNQGIYFGILQSENKYLGSIKLIAQ